MKRKSNHKLRLYVFAGFGKIIKSVKFTTLADPSINPGFNKIFEIAGITSNWYEYEVVVGTKHVLRYKSNNHLTIEVKRFLGICRIKLI